MTAANNPKGTDCACCELPSTRVTLDEYGQRLTLCDQCPSPDEIRWRAARVREGWDELEHWCRRHGMSRAAGLAAPFVCVEAEGRAEMGQFGRDNGAPIRLAL